MDAFKLSNRNAINPAPLCRLCNLRPISTRNTSAYFHYAGMRAPLQANVVGKNLGARPEGDKTVHGHHAATLHL
ncbi:hypothetical protein [Caudoviricetes sp.]|nr:hypothetical protein [Caudoviricetes sp.]UOF81533.1 hypothetical protein [Caudoviricetes sp.]